jgi:predicted PurR-regulated permease PerM
MKKANDVIDGITHKMGSWLRGQLLLMLVVGVLVAIGMAILGVPYALLLGVWAGITEFFPAIGPILGGLPGVILAFTTLGLVKGIIALVIYIVIQQLENHILVPRIMGKALGLSPVVIILSLLIGGQLLGFIGLIVAIPIAAVVSVIWEVWRDDDSE